MEMIITNSRSKPKKEEKKEMLAEGKKGSRKLKERQIPPKLNPLAFLTNENLACKKKEKKENLTQIKSGKEN